MYIVCAKYCGAVIELAEFDNKTDAEKFAQTPCHDDGLFEDPNEAIMPYEMWIEEDLDLPFVDYLTICEVNALKDERNHAC